MCVMAVFFALAAYAGPTHFIPTAQPFHMQPDDSLMWGTVALLFSSCLFPYLLKRFVYTQKQAMSSIFVKNMYDGRLLYKMLMNSDSKSSMHKFYIYLMYNFLIF